MLIARNRLASALTSLLPSSSSAQGTAVRHNSTSALPHSAPQQLATSSRYVAPARLKPISPSHYTARPTYIDSLLTLEQLTRNAKRTLEQAFVLRGNAPVPAPLTQTRGRRGQTGGAKAWVSPKEAGRTLSVQLKAAQYRQLVARLGTLERYADVLRHTLRAKQAGTQGAGASVQMIELSRKVDEVLHKFTRVEKQTIASTARASVVAADGDETAVPKEVSLIDENGRAYARGRRKESSARVWIIPTKQDAALGNVLVNGESLAAYFTRATHREAVLWPMRLAGTLGMFNVFALVRGGGTSGQAGAVAHALAGATVNWFTAQAEKRGDEARAQEIKNTLLKDGVLRRDSRMVERKKTGLAKARKAYTWVKR